MVPPGGTAHIAGGAERTDSDVHVWCAKNRARPGPAYGPAALPPGGAAVPPDGCHGPASGPGGPRERLRDRLSQNGPDALPAGDPGDGGPAAESGMSSGGAPGGASRERTAAEPAAAGRRAPGKAAPGWAAAVRGPWTVACTVATVLLSPPDVTASALDRANAAPRLTRGGSAGRGRTP